MSDRTPENTYLSTIFFTKNLVVKDVLLKREHIKIQNKRDTSNTKICLFWCFIGL